MQPIIKKIFSRNENRRAVVFAGLLGFLLLFLVITQLWAHRHWNMPAKKQKANVQAGLAMKQENQESFGNEISGEAQVNKSKKPVKMLFVGDLMLDRYNRQLLEKNGSGWFLENIEGNLMGYDLSVANLEGVISDNESLYNPDDLWDEKILRFTFDPEKSLGFLRDNNFNLVNLGNNHIDDFGASGLEQTLANLDRGDVGYFGDVGGRDINGKILEKNGIKIGFVSYNEFGGETASQIVQKIKNFRDKVDFLVVYAHWGKEYELEGNENQKQKAHSFVDAGADVVIGSHPHVVQPIEIYKNKAIFYSLGNFIFDQYFSEDTKNMLALAMVVSKKDISFQLVPLYLQPDGQVVLADEGKKRVLLERIASSLGDIRKELITVGVFKLDR